MVAAAVGAGYDMVLEEGRFKSRDLCLTFKSWFVQAHSTVLSHADSSIIQHGHGTSIK